MYHPDKYPVPENRVVGVTLWSALFLAIVFLLIGQIMAASDALILAFMWPETDGVWYLDFSAKFSKWGA